MKPRYLRAARTVQAAVQLPAEIRPPANDGDDALDVEIGGTHPRRRVERVRAALTELLPQIPELTAYALANAPTDWRRHYIDGEGAAVYTGLWLDAVTYDDTSVRL